MPDAPAPSVELFHAIADAASAKARTAVVQRGLEPRVRFRNVVYPEVVADLQKHGRGAEAVPALFDGRALHVGLEAVLAALDRL